MDRKTIRISSKRQITIPQKYYDHLGFSDQAECILRGSELIIRPAVSQGSGEFDREILKELIEQGYSGDKLLAQFEATQAKVRLAVERMIDEADAIALGKIDGVPYDELFGED